MCSEQSCPWLFPRTHFGDLVMKRASKRLGVMVLASAAGLIAAGCAAGNDEDVRGTGQLNLALETQGPSGVTYHLRHASFRIQREANYYEETAGNGPDAVDTIVSSDSDPNASTVTVSVEEGIYLLQLLPGWSFEKQGPNEAEPVEATLLSAASQTIYVRARSSTWAAYDFGIGNREFWLNGKLNIGIYVEEPSEAGAGGQSAVAPPDPRVGEGGAP